MSHPSLDAVLAKIDANLGASLERLKELVRIKSISTDPAFAAECQRAAEWLANDLRAEGFDAATRTTPGHPMVVGHDRTGNGPHVVFYGHYDVQPVDPLDLWNSDPFEVEMRKQPDGETHLVGRGTSDDKGQLLTFIEACRAWRASPAACPCRSPSS